MSKLDELLARVEQLKADKVKHEEAIKGIDKELEISLQWYDAIKDLLEEKVALANELQHVSDITKNAISKDDLIEAIEYLKDIDEKGTITPNNFTKAYSIAGVEEPLPDIESALPETA